jgi:hypothetical protein
MADGAEQDVQPVPEVDTPAGFLATLGLDLREKPSVDAGLADILIAHILKVPAAPNAVAQAKDAILKLAGERANPPKLEEPRD